MSPELHQQVRRLFDEALDLPKAERLPFLEAACAGRPEVFEAVSRLLAAHVESDSFLESPPPPPPPPPKHIGRYVVTGELGRGAMGIVFEAIDPLIGRSVAVKTIHLQAVANAGEAEFLSDRLFREARSAGSLSHPGIVTIFDVGREADTAFIAMERVEGKSLQQILASGRKLKISAALDILRQMAAALDYAHANGVVHRDIKPANVMLHKTATVKITDFGIAKFTSQNQTATGMVMGTPSYMSPEQIQLKPLDGRSDQFALAVVAYELLTGACPFKSDSLASLVLMIVTGDRPSACQSDPTLPPAVDAVLQRGLSKLRDDRFGSCAEFVAALEVALPATPPPPPPTPKSEMETLKDVVPRDALPPVTIPPPYPEPVPSPPKSRILYLLAAGGLVVVLAAVLVYKSGVISGPGGKPAATVAPPPVKQAEPMKPAAPAAPATHEPPATGPGETSSAKTSAGPTTTTVHPKQPQLPKPKEQPKEKQPKEKQPENDTVSRAGDLYTAGTVKKLAKQPGEALPLFRESAALGDARAMVEIGKLYLAGDGVGKDINEAVSWFRKASDAGNTSGMVFLAAMYAQGSGVPRDDKEAVRLFRKAADGGDLFGMDGLGQVYANGRGVTKDDKEAVRWFQKAADAGSASGTYHLAAMYEKGSGVPKDLNKAIELHHKAAQLGSKDAQSRLAQLEKQQPGGGPAPARPTVHVRVVGNQAWTDTGIDVNAGDTVIVGADGTIVLNRPRIPAQSPDGYSPDCSAAAAAFGQNFSAYPDPRLPCWSLIARIGPSGPILQIGKKRVLKATTPGRLYFGINDGSVQGNSGVWTALVVVQPTR